MSTCDHCEKVFGEFEEEHTVWVTTDRELDLGLNVTLCITCADEVWDENQQAKQDEENRLQDLAERQRDAQEWVDLA